MPGVGVLFLCHHFGRSFVSILFLLTELRSRAKKGRSQHGFTGREQYTKVLLCFLVIVQNIHFVSIWFSVNNNPVLGCGCHNSKEAYQNLEGSLMNRRKVRKETSTPALPTFPLSLLISISSH
ncbi:hypothetical protein D6C87_10422 [Aureobasidium pullulans]|uniref:Secreted protein n=1 Tax=Aureobasidium pullulans TaxID=5580 RepID=A0AB38LGS1_AURPU|nr:hypothetical protein D6C94_10729 [Aureobasidium pullulans]THZ34430.1 hypothetical protein D6C87_10422 [Aureobasidium pullulans]